MTEEEICRAESKVSDSFKKNVKFLHEQIEKFALAQKAGLKDFELETLEGVHLGQKYIPLNSVGVYVPGGRYRLIASAQMSIVPAKVAGVKRIVACAPAKGEVIDPQLLHSMQQAGADEIYALGGAQAIAAMAFGAGIMAPVDMIAGPGNVYVAEAKRQLYGVIGVDFIAGPTEILVIADETADPTIVDTGGLWVGKYLKNVTYQWLSKKGSLTVAPVAAAIAKAEGMVAHARTAEIRVKKYSATLS